MKRAKRQISDREISASTAGTQKTWEVGEVKGMRFNRAKF